MLINKKYSANYSFTNHNFIIQNLPNNKIANRFLPAIYILKNILQRGRPTIMSKYLQQELGEIHYEDDFKKPFVLIDQAIPIWHDTIKGDEENQFFPAKTFVNSCINEDLPNYSFISRLIVPEISINEITQQNDNKFQHQYVDFFLSAANIVIEIDGQQHKESTQRINDQIRDDHLKKFRVRTVRIAVSDLTQKTKTYYNKIQELENLLSDYDKILNLYKVNHDLSFKKYLPNVVKKKLTPTAIIRFQMLLLDLIESGTLSLEDSEWQVEVLNHDVTGFETLACEDLFIWFRHLLSLQKIEFAQPQVNIDSVSQFSMNSGVKIDFSVLKRWTDENKNNVSAIFVRTDYQDLFFNKTSGKPEKVNYFKVSVTSPVKYNLIRHDEHNDQENLIFFLKNIFGFDDFTPGQTSIIENALSCRDTIGLLPTGGGKSLTYQLVCLLQPCISYVVCPIKSLMYDQLKDLESAYIHNVAHITSDTKGAHRDQILDNFGSGKYFYIFVSPERFQTQDFRDRLIVINKALCYSYAVIDEVHCLSEWGHDFRTSYLNLSKVIKSHCKDIKFLGLTATASVNVLKDIQIEFHIEQEDVKTLIDYTRPELEFEVIRDNGQKERVLKKLLEKKYQEEDIFNINSIDTKCGLIFTPNVNGPYGCYGLASSLSNFFGVKIEFYSGSEPKRYSNTKRFDEYKQEVQIGFKENKFSLLVATKAFGMGINKSNIRYTIHYGIPSSMESLYQEAGRAGRDKSPANCYVLLSEEKTNLDRLFNPDASYEEIEKISKNVGWDGLDVFRQIFLYKIGLDPIPVELELLDNLHKQYSEPNTKKIVYAEQLKADKSKVEKAIYRLSNLGIVSDWTVEDFFKGIFTVSYNNYSDVTVQETLMKFIRKYVDDFELDNKEDRKKYTDIFTDQKLTEFQKSAKILLQWSYDKFGANRRESLKNVYYNCLSYDSTPEGKENFKKALEAYFKFTQATYILQHIADNNDVDIEKWFEVFYNQNNHLINRDKLRDLEGNLQRFLESYQSNTGLNLINALTILLQEKKLDSIQNQRLNVSIKVISEYQGSQYDYIRDQIYNISILCAKVVQHEMWNLLYRFTATGKGKLILAKKLGDIRILLPYYNNRLKSIKKRLYYGIKKR
jgi:ATP-dependent DNA helicase RecQ